MAGPHHWDFDGRHRYTAEIMLLCVLVFRIVYLAVVPFDLIHDEAYYWDWSRQLDWCYYSKPPGIAWLLALMTRMTAATTFFVKLPAAILSVVTAYFVYCLGSRIYHRQAGFVAAALLCLTPGNAAAGVMMTIDAPFLCCWSLALYCFWRMLERGEDRLVWTALTVLAVGTGMLFKQTMLAFPVLAISFVALSHADRVELKRLSFWGCGVLALAFWFPVLLWNAKHDWVTFSHTRGHFDAASVSIGQRCIWAGEFILGQAGVVSPLIYLMLAASAVLHLRCWKGLSRKELYLAWFWIGPLVAVTILSFRQRVEANWPAPFYASGVILLAAAALGYTPIRLPTWTLQRSMIVGLVSVAIAYGLPFATRSPQLRGSAIDIAARMRGWRDLGVAVDERLGRADGDEQTVYVTSAGRGVAAELAFYLPNQPRVHLWDTTAHIDSQYDIWGLPDNFAAHEVVFLSDKPSLPRECTEAFERVEDLGTVTIEVGQHRGHRLQVWRLHPAVDARRIARGQTVRPTR